jgi:2-hydroxychromene-2-carboxylate isomerase
MKTVEFQFDFGSANAYLAHKVVRQIEARTGARFDYVPVLLGGVFKLTNNQSPMQAYANIPNKLAYERLEMDRFIKHHNIPFVMNPFFPVNTLLMMRMATAAAMDGGLMNLINATFPLMWERGLNMGDPDVIASNLAAAGIDAARLMARAQEDDVKQCLMTTTENAVKRGAFGSPTFFVNGDIYFGKNTLPEIEARLTP